MNIYKKIFTSSIFIIAFGIIANAQINKANEYFENYEYANAIPIYKKVNEKKYNNLAVKRLAISYKKINDSENAEYWYKKLVENSDVNPTFKLDLAKILITNNKPEEAKIWVNAYKNQVPSDPSILILEEQLSKTDEYKVDSFFYKTTALNINSTESSFSPVYYRKGILFTSQRNAAGKNETDTWTGNGCFNLYYAEKIESGDFNEPKLLKGDIKSPFHEGPSSFVKKTNRIYFTRSNMKKSHLEKNDSSINNLQLYTSVLEDGEWGGIQKLSFNNHNYSYGHPTLTKDGNTMYFVSDQPNGIGKTDIYVSHFSNFKWSKPQNIGTQINTTGTEMFPFIDDNRDTLTLYYSTNGKPGLGGMDIYYSNYIDGEWQKPIHMSYPINSSKDDFGLVFNENHKEGYFSSNRDGENGYDKIYAFELVTQEFFMSGAVKDLKSKKPIANVSIKIMNRTLKNVHKAETDENGAFFFKVENESEFVVTGDLKGYFSDSKNATTVGMRKTDTVYVALELDKLEVAKAIRLDNIYYDYNKWDIRLDAMQELNRLVATLKENPKVKIELSSHTDSRGSDNYNKKLSQKRAQSAVDYIVENGINRDRMVAKGYGETKLLNNCDDGVECTEDQHQFNRRTEFKVLSK